MTALTIASFPPEEIDRIEAAWTGTGAHFEPLVLGLIATIRDRESAGGVYCVEDGCHQPATTERPTDVPDIVELVCPNHTEQPAT